MMGYVICADLYNVGRAKDDHYPVRLQSGILCSLSIDLSITFGKDSSEHLYSFRVLAKSDFWIRSMVQVLYCKTIFPTAGSDPFGYFHQCHEVSGSEPIFIIFLYMDSYS